MDTIQIQGGRRLQGTVRVQGSKNGVLPLMAAALIIPGKTVLKGCPRITDVSAMADAMTDMGCRISRQGDDLIIDATGVHTSRVPRQCGEKLRSSVLFLGALLARTGLAILPYPGGCTIGARPVDFHLEGMRRLGVFVYPDGEWIRAVGRPGGGSCRLPMASVGATENLLLAASCCAEPVTIQGAAREPEIVGLCEFLSAMGADVRGAGTDTISITGVEAPGPVTFRVPGDRIIAGTYLLAAAATGGRILLQGIPSGMLADQIDIYRQLGLRLWENRQGILAVREGSLRPVQCATAPYPGFPTDLQSQLMAVAACAPGESRITETVFEHRFQVAEELCRMGADIHIEGQTARITGVPRLAGCSVEAKELRGGAALIIAGLAAEGITRITGVNYIRRGYGDIAGDLRRLGADIRDVRE